MRNIVPALVFLFLVLIALYVTLMTGQQHLNIEQLFGVFDEALDFIDE